MRRFVLLGVVAAFCWHATPASGQTPNTRRLSRAVLEDKIRGGWAGQMIGVSYGAPTEFRSNGRIIRWQIDWKPEHITNSIQQDDLYVEMTFAEVMDKVGLDATTEQFGEMFKDSKYDLWHANASARRLLNRGIKAPLSGHPKYNLHANDIDFQIESDFIGLMTPGLPQRGQHLRRPGRPRDELRRRPLRRHVLRRHVLRRLLRERPAQGGRDRPDARSRPRAATARIIRDVLDWSATEPDDWEKTWQRIDGEVGPRRRLPGRRAARLQHRRASERRVRRAGPALRQGRLRRRHSRSRPAPARTPTATRRAPPGSWASSWASATFPTSGSRAFQRSPTEVRLHELFVQRASSSPPWRGR